MKQYFLILLLLLPLLVNAQSNIGIAIDSDLSVNNSRAYGVASFDLRDKTYSGSSLIWPDFLYGKVLLKGNSKYTENEYKLSYDAQIRTLFIKMHNQIYTIQIDKVSSILIDFGKQEYQEFVVLKDNEGLNDLFRILLTTKQFSLLERKKASLSRQYYNTALDAGEIKPSINLNDQLFIHKSENLFELPKKRKKFVDQYENVDEIKDIVSYFKEIKVDFRNTDEVQNALIELNKTK